MIEKLTKKRNSGKLIYGVGINDAEYAVYKTDWSSGKQMISWVCPYYSKWIKILQRCYCAKYLKLRPTYEGCEIEESWKKFTVFKLWVDSQPNRNWENCEPDKDLIVEGNKLYSPNTVVFVTEMVNNFLKIKTNSRGNFMLGVSFHKKIGKFQAMCNNPFTLKAGAGRFIGYFNTELEAHKAWQAKKHEYACALVELQDDPRVAKALRERYAPDKDWTNK
jgi:hypothetical protein